MRGCVTLTLNAWAVQQISPFVCCAKLQAKNARHAHLFGRHAQADGLRRIDRAPLGAFARPAR